MVYLNHIIKRFFRKLIKSGCNNGLLVKNLPFGKANLNVFGYFDYIFSISSNARDFVNVAGLNLIGANLVPLRMVHKSICEDRSLLDCYSMPSESANINLWFVNFDMIDDCYKKHYKWFINRYNIAVFWWEFDNYFPNIECCEYLDEIVVFSSVTYRALCKVIPLRVKLTWLEYPFIGYVPKLSRQELLSCYALDQYKTYILFVFDIHSHIERKNPHGAAKAFQIAWQKNHNLHLIFKITNFELWRDDCREFLSYIRSLGIYDNVTIIPDNLTEEGMRELVGGCDIYISLHRAEGLGLGMLEAMSMGKPVVATRFGGNLDFMNDNNSLLVDYKMVEVQKTFADYREGYKWAEPDIDMAAKYLLKLSTNTELHDEISTKAKESIHKQYEFYKLKSSYAAILNR